jgi:hypothetical protein
VLGDAESDVRETAAAALLTLGVPAVNATDGSNASADEQSRTDGKYWMEQARPGESTEDFFARAFGRKKYSDAIVGSMRYKCKKCGRNNRFSYNESAYDKGYSCLCQCGHVTTLPATKFR